MPIPVPPIDFQVFTFVALFMVAAACVVTFSRKLIYSAFALLGTLFGSAVMFGMLSADFVAVTQLLVYVGGVLILILFAVMLTADIEQVNVTNRIVHYKAAVPLAFAFLMFLLAVLPGAGWFRTEASTSQSMVKPIGNALLQEYLLPFEVISVLLLGALIGAVVMVRREVR